ncbi:MAG: hypothetical protein P8R54_30320 [Myxococcota bacterium]|nr:hypothetical protein [Myxococcota bacterium]
MPQRRLGCSGIAGALSGPCGVAVPKIAKGDVAGVAQLPAGSPERLVVAAWQQGRVGSLVGSELVDERESSHGQPDDALAAGLRRPTRHPQQGSSPRGLLDLLRGGLDPVEAQPLRLHRPKTGGEDELGLSSSSPRSTISLLLPHELSEPLHEHLGLVELTTKDGAGRIITDGGKLRHLSQQLPALGDHQPPTERLGLLANGLPARSLIPSVCDVGLDGVVAEVSDAVLRAEQPGEVLPAVGDAAELSRAGALGLRPGDIPAAQLDEWRADGLGKGSGLLRSFFFESGPYAACCDLSTSTIGFSGGALAFLALVGTGGEAEFDPPVLAVPGLEEVHVGTSRGVERVMRQS